MAQFNGGKTMYRLLGKRYVTAADYGVTLVMLAVIGSVTTGLFAHLVGNRLRRQMVQL